MITKFRFGEPFDTEAVVSEIPQSAGMPEIGKISLENGFRMEIKMDPDEIIYGLGEANRGINKRGWIYESNTSDEPNQTEGKRSFYAADNFLLLSGKEKKGIFLDYPGYMTFDIGYTREDLLVISCERTDLDLYVIDGASDLEIVKQFRTMIGRSYIPPKFAFGYGQSRWGYRTAEDFREVVRKHREAHVPLDMVYMDIDYMDHYKDFTVNKEEFPDFPAYVSEMKEQGIHLVPIIDAGVKVEDGYSVYEEGVEKGYFCKKADGKEFKVAVWPGWTHFPDFLNKDAAKWFGDQYKVLLDAGIDGFWNDMNEPATFYSEEGLKEMKEYLQKIIDETVDYDPSILSATMLPLANNPEDYRRFYHKVNGKMIRHDQVHNLFGYNMTKSAGESFERNAPEKRILMFSRSSYVGMHRYGGIWMGDNHSWWSQMLLDFKMLPSLNMCGFLYTGADLGGFGSNTTRDLLLRWYAVSLFTPLMRNHSARGTRLQEFYQFEGTDDFRFLIELRYRLIPYLYSEFMKAALNNDMMFAPLGFIYPDDEMAKRVETQLMLGNEVMIAPVFEQNAVGRYVYLPEEMMQVRFKKDGSIEQKICEKGHHYIDVALNEVVFFIRKGKCIPLAQPAETVDQINTDKLEMIGYKDAEYDRYDDDGTTPIR